MKIKLRPSMKHCFEVADKGGGTASKGLQLMVFTNQNKGHLL
ncbi:hypothetical protein STRDD11_00440 [Streptococcus sp. DD11]|nr:hypothetical protein STRDD11_00440 [Streptococcus sp. DD11]